MRQSAGFTLIEMMIVVVIMAILLAIGMPAFQTFIQNTQIRTAAESMLAGLSLARTEALRRNAPVSLWLVDGITASCARSDSGTSWVVSLDDPVGACNAASSDSTAPRLVQFRSGSDGSSAVSVSAMDGDSPAVASSCITFNGFGRVQPSCTDGNAPIARIVFTSATTPSSTRALEVRVPSGGSIRMCDPAVTSATDPAAC